MCCLKKYTYPLSSRSKYPGTLVVRRVDFLKEANTILAQRGLKTFLNLKTLNLVLRVANRAYKSYRVASGLSKESLLDCRPEGVKTPWRRQREFLLMSPLPSGVVPGCQLLRFFETLEVDNLRNLIFMAYASAK